MMLVWTEAKFRDVNTSMDEFIWKVIMFQDKLTVIAVF